MVSWRVLVFVVVGVFYGLPSVSAQTLHHRLSVRIQPVQHTLEVVDRVSLGGAVSPDEAGAYRFVLHGGLSPRLLTEGWRLEPVDGPVEAGFFGINATTDTVAERVPLEAFLLVPEEEATQPVEIAYGGRIDHALATQGEEYQRSFSETPGIIDERGVFLAGASFWVPTFGDGLMTFELEVNALTPPWKVVSQGRRTHHDGHAARRLFHHQGPVGVAAHDLHRPRRDQSG